MDKTLEENSSVKLYFRLLEYVKPLWFFFILSLCGHIAFASTQAAFAHVIKYFVEALEGNNDQLVYLVPIGVLFIALTRAVASFVGSYYMTKVGQKVVHQLRCELFEKTIYLPCSFFDNTKSGHLMNRIKGNVGRVTAAVTGAITIIVREGMTVVFLMGYLFWSNWKLTLIFLFIVPILSFIVIKVGHRLRDLSHKAQEAAGELTHVLSESIKGYRVMRTYSGENYELDRFRRASKEGLRQGLKIQRTMGIATPMIQLLVISAMAIVMYFILSLRSETDTATLIAYITAAGLIPKPLRQLSEVHGTIQKSLAACERIFELMDTTPEHDSGTFEKSRVEGKLCFQNVSFQYGENDAPAINNINLSIKAGQSIGLVGRSGSGKSTLISLIPRFYDSQKGMITLDDIKITEYSLKNLRKQIALVSQDVTLFNDSIASNISYGALRKVSREEIEQAARMAYAYDFISELSDGFNTIVGENGIKLSGGQRQRISIARAILKNAPILIMDEATSALDTESERFIQKALVELMKNRTTIVIAHRLSTIKSVDQIIVLEKGQIIEAGSHDELLAQDGTYKNLYKLQFSL